MPLRKSEVELLRHITDGRTGVSADELASWLEARRFATFVSTHRDKIRKKLRTASDEAAAASVRAELGVAYRLLLDTRFEITPEAFGVGNRGPDLTVRFRSGARFNIEVTQLRTAGGIDARVPAVLLVKLRQLPAGMANVVVVAVPSPPDDLPAAMRSVKARVERGGDYLRLSAVCVVWDAGLVYWANREARHPLPAEAARALERCLAAPAGTVPA